MAAPLRIEFTYATPLGDVQASFELADDALRHASDDLFDGGEQVVPWSAVREAGTATLARIRDSKPDMARFVPRQIEWLMLVRQDGQRDFMRRLPALPAERDALVDAVRARTGARWLGEHLSVHDARARLGKAAQGDWSTGKTVLLVISVLALLVLLLFAITLLAHPVVAIPGLLAGGAWLAWRGRNGLRAADTVSQVHPAALASAGPGFGLFEGLAVGAQPSPSAITGRPCVWWDVSIQAWYENDADADSLSGWNQLAARHGGRIGVVEIDGGGAVPTPVWLKDAELLLAQRVWESAQDTLPEPGLALLREIGFGWGAGQRLRVVETGVEVGAPLFVLGTLGPRSELPPPGATPGLFARVSRLVHTGQWRRALVGALPRPLRLSVATLIGLVDMITGVGRGGERFVHAAASDPPALAPAQRLLWKGGAGLPFVVSDQSPGAAVDALRRRSWVKIAIAAALVFMALTEVFD